jgi:hypothetical protein
LQAALAASSSRANFSAKGGRKSGSRSSFGLTSLRLQGLSAKNCRFSVR